MLFLFQGICSYSFHPRFPLQLILTESLGTTDRRGHSFIHFYSKWLGCPCFHGGNHVQVVMLTTDQLGVRYFTLMSLPPRVDYCNCLLTMCSAGFHTSSSCRGRELWAVCVMVKGEASMPVGPSSPSLCPVCWCSDRSFCLLWVVIMCPWPRRSLWILTMNFVVKSCPMQLPKVTQSLV